MIDSYSFGRIVIDGVVYDSDVLIFPGRVIGGWRRLAGHSLCMEDLAPIMDNPPELLVVGCGYVSRMKLDGNIAVQAAKQGIRLEIHDTKTACAALNKAFNEGVSAAGAFHLTC